ncbi:hypothetical protein B0T11DRAFT_140530 [Plectosphaerella cucumerina]|uniref:Uncharacterized protein n=1 Tax=Plectosphaerella cucumerina TaxID=40658 RepID=A0A8K0WXM1_9PEZI|nr:hypothetical protein B0T11DRAFT_140530 [Plectosphaerella cucumerina]
MSSIKSLLSLLPLLALVRGESVDATLEGSAQNALTFAYQYGFPLTAYGQFVRKTGGSENVLHHNRALADSDFRAVVRPNVDTLYSSMFYDVSHHDLNITFPELEDRLWLFSFYDIYGNNFANIGSLDAYSAGSYRVRQDAMDFGVSAEATEGFLGQVNSPTPHGLLLVRTAVYQSDETYTTVHAFQDAIDIQLAQRTSFPEKAPPKLDLALFSDPRFNPEQKGTTLASATLELLAFFHPISPPRIAQDAAWIDTMLVRAGLSNGSFTQPDGTSLEGAAALANLTARASLNQAGFRQYLGSNWTLTAPDVSGDFGSFYNVRQKIAMDGYLMLTADQAIYPSYTAPDGAWELEVGRDEAVLLTFKDKPFLVDTGFWSITLYGEDSYLIENDLRRYALSSRDNLTYPDGSLVRDGSGTDVPFQVLIQPGGNSPPKNWTDNWVPGPRDGGKFTMHLRLYGAREEMLDGTYEYPTVTFVQALREDTEPIEATLWDQAWAQIRRVFGLLAGSSGEEYILDL